MGKIDVSLLEQYLSEGKTNRECSKIFEVSDAAICQAKKRIGKFVVRNAASKQIAPVIVQKNLDTVEQLQKINKKANELLNAIEDDPAMSVKIMAEIRGQLKLQLELFQALYDVQAAAEFQNEVLTVIGEVDQDVRDRIIYKLSSKRALRQAICEP